MNEHIFNKRHYEWFVTTAVDLLLNQEQLNKLVYLLHFTNPRFDAKWFRAEVAEYKSYHEYDDAWGLIGDEEE